MCIMNSFIYEIPTKIYFGENELNGNLKTEIQKYGNKVLLLFIEFAIIKPTNILLSVILNILEIFLLIKFIKV